jgi:hypothetical protein
MEQTSQQPPKDNYLRLVVIGILILAVLFSCLLIFPGLLVPARSSSSLEAIEDPKERAQLEDSRLKLQNDARTTLLQALGGAFFLLTAFFTWRQTRINQQQLDLTRQQVQQNSDLNQEQLRLAREGQITERFSKAIEHLGSESNGQKNLDTRIGGIFALERIAKNSSDDQRVVAEVLCAYVREHSPWPPPANSPYSSGHPTTDIPLLRSRASDVQTIMTVLGRIANSNESPPTLNLRKVDLRQAVLNRGDLRRVILQGSHLEGADLIITDLREAKLGPDLQGKVSRDWGANFTDAHLGNADLRGADLNRTILTNAFLYSADFRKATMTGANLKGANIKSADFREVDLSSTLLDGARADGDTKWPEGFDPKQANVLME